MSILGYDGPANTTDGNSGSDPRVFRFTADTSFTATKLSVNIADSGDYRFAVYEWDFGNSPLLATIATVTLTGDGNWEEFSLSQTVSITSGTEYAIGIWKDGPFSINATDTQSATEQINSTSYDWTADPWPDPWGTSTGGSGGAPLLYIADSGTSGPTISSVTDSVGSIADQVTSGATADIALDSAIGTQGTSTVVLQDSTGTYSESGTINNWDETTDTITVTFSQSGMRFGDADNEITVTLDDGSTATATGITFASPSGTYYVNGSSPDTTSENSVFYNALSAPTAGYQIIWRDPNDVGGASPGSLINADGSVPDIASPGDVPVRAWDDSDGTTSAEVTYTATLQAPQGQVTITDTSVSGSDVTITWSYDDTDITGWGYSIDGGAVTEFGDDTTTSHTITGLADGTYDIEIIPINDGGQGAGTDTTTATVDTGGVSAPAGTITLGTAAISDTSLSQPYTYDSDDADSFEYRLDGGTWQAAGQPLQVFGLDPDTQYALDIRPVNEGGSGTAASTTITTEASDDSGGADLSKINQSINSSIATPINSSISTA